MLGASDYFGVQRIVKVFLDAVGVLLNLHEVDLVALMVGAHLQSFSICVVQGHRVHDLVEQGVVAWLIMHRKCSLYDRVRIRPARLQLSRVR